MEHVHISERICRHCGSPDQVADQFVMLRELQNDCWSVSSEYDEKIVSQKHVSECDQDDVR